MVDHGDHVRIRLGDRQQDGRNDPERNAPVTAHPRPRFRTVPAILYQPWLPRNPAPRRAFLSLRPFRR